MDAAPRSIRDYAPDCRALDLAAFRRTHGDAFLLHSQLTSARLQPESSPTMNSGDREISPSPGPDFLVFPIRKRGEGRSSGFVSVGRARKNDVVIPDGTLTMVQAFFGQDEAGRFTLLDAASKNGTFVNDRPAPAWGKGDGVLLEDGARVRFGTLELIFLHVEGFIRLVTALT